LDLHSASAAQVIVAVVVAQAVVVGWAACLSVDVVVGFVDVEVPAAFGSAAAYYWAYCCSFVVASASAEESH